MFQGCWQKTQNTCVRGRRQLYYSGQEQGPEVPVAARFPCPHPRVLWGHAGGTRCLPVSRDRSTEESVAFPVNRSKPALWGGVQTSSFKGAHCIHRPKNWPGKVCSGSCILGTPSKNAQWGSGPMAE